MKRIVLLLAIIMVGLCAKAQKFVFVDTDYILRNMPSYEVANEQLGELSKRYEAEIKAKMQEVETLYEAYRTESVFLTNEMKIAKENEIIEKENSAKQLQQTYFGQGGEFFKQRETLVKPIQDQVFNAISSLAKEKNYSVVFDKSSNIGVMYSDSSLDISDEVLNRLGYAKK
jgi:outer membrane protein